MLCSIVKLNSQLAWNYWLGYIFFIFIGKDREKNIGHLPVQNLTFDNFAGCQKRKNKKTKIVIAAITFTFVLVFYKQVYSCYY